MDKYKTKLFSGTTYVDLDELEQENRDNLFLEENSLDRTKMANLHVCCYQFKMHIEYTYLKSLLQKWNASKETNSLQQI